MPQLSPIDWLIPFGMFSTLLLSTNSIQDVNNESENNTQPNNSKANPINWNW